MQHKTIHQLGLPLALATVLAACGGSNQEKSNQNNFLQPNDSNTSNTLEETGGISPPPSESETLEGGLTEIDNHSADTVRNELAQLDLPPVNKTNNSNADSAEYYGIAYTNLLAANHGLGFATAKFSSTVTGKERDFNIDGRALIRRFQGRTQVSVQVSGLTPDTQYMGHVHDLPCDTNNGGGHYKINPSIDTAQESNEIWFSFQADSAGYAIDENTVGHVARPEAQAIVIHDVDGARIACATLEEQAQPTEPVSVGIFRPLSGTPEVAIEGYARLIRQKNGSKIQLTLSGLEASADYPAHLHNLPCDVTSGGGHYKMDPTITDTLENNEVWLSFTSDGQGRATQESAVDHVIRPEGQSVVIHNSSGTRLACADLVSPLERNYYALGTDGVFTPTPDGFDVGYRGLYGLANVIRLINGETHMAAIVAGLAPGKTYMAHVHNKSCAQGGGGHYKIDPSIAETKESNELWLNFRSDYWGMARAQVSRRNHMMRADARAIVIHESSDPSIRIACMDI